MRFEDIDIHELLPQQEPFVMIDRLLHFDERLTTTELTVRPTNLFFEGGRLLAPALIENVAQTCAARIGYINKYILHRDIAIGYIGSVRNLDILRTPLEGETITTTIEIQEEVMQLVLATAVIRVADEVICQGEIKIALDKTEEENA